VSISAASNIQKFFGSFLQKRTAFFALAFLYGPTALSGR
jgi:hypothetical protein